MEQLLLAPKRAGEVLDLGKTKVFELIAAGELETVRIGRARRVVAESLTDYVARRRAASQVAS